MVCYAVQHNLPQSAEGMSGLCPNCVATSVGSFIGDVGMKKIPLSQNKFAMVDDEDYAWLMQWKWCVQKGVSTWYVQRAGCLNGKWVSIQMHRVIMKTPQGLDTDHINHNGLDNQRHNLRNCTNRQNQQNARLRIDNTSGYKGVSRAPRSKPWQARIRYSGRNLYLGSFLTATKAAEAYDDAAIKYFGEFAHTNFPEGVQQ